MRILYLNTSDAGGGGNQLAADLFRTLRGRGHRMSLAVRFQRTDDPDVFEFENDRYRSPIARVVHSALRTHVTTENAGSRARTLRHRLAIAATEPRRALRAWQGFEDFDFPGTASVFDRSGIAPDLVHIHIGHGNYLDLREIVPLARRAPIVLTLHDYWFMTGGCRYFGECPRWRTTCGECPEIPNPARDRTPENRALKASVYRDAPAFYVTAPSLEVTQHARESILAPARLIEAVPNCYDADVFRPQDRAAARREFGLPDDAVVLMLAAQSATRAPFKDWPTMHAALTTIGAQYRGDRPLHAMALGADESFSIPGITVQCVPFVESRVEMARRYAAADVFLHSAREEAWGLVITESMACGTPVVATNVGGIPDQMIDGTTGYLVPRRSPLEFADRAMRLIVDEPLRRQMGQAAARHAIDHFAAARVAEQYESFYAKARADWLSLGLDRR